MESITVKGGEVQVERRRFGVDYTVDVMAHPYFDRLSFEQRVLLLHTKKRRQGTRLTWGGCAEWTPEQFLETVACTNDVSEALAACLCEDNYVSQALGVRDFDGARERLAAARVARLQETLATLAAEGIVLADPEAVEPADDVNDVTDDNAR